LPRAGGWLYYGGLFSLAAGVDVAHRRLGGQLLIMHMVQHKILVMFAAPLLWLGNPYPVGALGAAARVRVRSRRRW
jgi:cytochrome c oxidase assembly factor CtaG